MNEFLNPKSMATPGAAGALMMLIANAVCNNFPEFPFRYVALGLSFVIGAVVFSASTMKIWERGIYWVVNSLIIFSMGVGATNIAANVAAKQASNEQSTSVASAIMTVFVGAAFAQDGKTALPVTVDTKNKVSATTGANQANRPSEADLLARIKVLEARVSELQADNERLQQKSQTLNAPVYKSAAVPTKSAPALEPAASPKAIADRPVPESFFKKW